MGFDDLLNRLDQALLSEEGAALAATLRTSYPAAMIDEFQDTDQQQYRIFKNIYNTRQTDDCLLLLIGDPKQAIYAFRGADIFTYMRARSEVDYNYTLDKNWRSTPAMINAVNHLFQYHPTPFIFSDIPFYPVEVADCNARLKLIVQRQLQPAMRIWFHSGNSVSVSEYQKIMAQGCAITLREWLTATSKGETWLEGHGSRRILQASDITVLVRNRNEAVLIRDALSKLLIHSVYLSDQDSSVFKTPEARELLWILQAVLNPEQKNFTLCFSY